MRKVLVVLLIALVLLLAVSSVDAKKAKGSKAEKAKPAEAKAEAPKVYTVIGRTWPIALFPRTNITVFESQAEEKKEEKAKAEKPKKEKAAKADKGKKETKPKTEKAPKAEEKKAEAPKAEKAQKEKKAKAPKAEKAKAAKAPKAPKAAPTAAENEAAYVKLSQKLASLDAQLAAIPALVCPAAAEGQVAPPCPVAPAAAKLATKRTKVQAELTALEAAGVNKETLAAKVLLHFCAF